ncbi:MAG: hypothetical protein R3C15_01070 [Thermoleophilia bacterium]
MSTPDPAGSQPLAPGGLRPPGAPAPEPAPEAGDLPIEPLPEAGGLRLQPARSLAPQADEPTDPVEAARGRALVRSATRNGRRVVTLRRIDVGDECVVECDVYPANSLKVEPVRPGPYRFAEREQGDRFVEEALLALEYLGCELA